MQLHITGHQVDVTAAIRSYAEDKMARIGKHFDHHLDIKMILRAGYFRSIRGLGLADPRKYLK